MTVRRWCDSKTCWGSFRAWLLVALLLAAARSAGAQSELPLYEQPPFDLITLKRDMSQHRILPLELPVRSKVTPQTSGTLRVRLLEDPVDERAIRWTEIERIDLYEELVLAEANRLASEQQFDEAFRHYAFLLDRYPKLEGLDAAVQSYLFASASDFVSRQRYAEALSALEELFQRNNSYVASSGRDVASALSAVAGIQLSQYVSAGQYPAARTLLTRLEQQYGAARLPAIEQWRSKIIAAAEAQVAATRKLLDENKLLEAQQSAREVLRIWPALEGGLELARETVRRYPIATVGVMQRAQSPDPSNSLNWAARRAGRLTDRLLVEYVAPGPEGGKYVSPLGTLERSDDFRQLALQMRPAPASGSGDAPAQPTGYDLSDRLLQLANPQHSAYQPGWADVLDTVRVSGVYRVEARLRRPHVVPEGFLQVPLRLDATEAAAGSSAETQPATAAPAESAGDPPAAPGDHWSSYLIPYQLAEQDEQATRFLRRSEFVGGADSMPAEVRERFFADPADAIAALRRGDILAIDRLFPSDAARLRADPAINVQAYALPTLHMLVPNLNDPFLNTPTFRRALVHAIPRQLILDRLLDNQPVAGCRIITGPFPAGRSPDDPIAYAYDNRLDPRPFDAGVASLLLRMAQNQLDTLAQKAEQPAPKLEPLVLAHPEDAMARFACEIIARQLTAVQVPCQLKQLPPGQVTDPSGEYDLLYVVMTVSEPMIDAERLLGREGLASSTSPYIALALRQVQEAKTWREARERLQQLHQLAYSEVTVIPLWQMIEHFAYSDNLRGLAADTVTLYQDVERWQLEPVLAGEQ